MMFHFPVHRPLRPLVVAFVVFLLAAVVAAGVIWRMAQADILSVREHAALEAANHANALQRGIERTLSATYALAALVRQGNGAIHNFTTVASQMLPLYPGAASLQLAPRGIVQDIVPLAGNEAAIGHDLLQDPTRTKAAFLARDTRKLTLDGPFDLRQGGMGAVARLPVFLNDANGSPVFWGFTSVLIRFPEALEAAHFIGLTEQGYAYQLWRIHPDSGKTQIIAASSSAALIEPVQKIIEVPNATWTLSVVPVEGWREDPLEFSLEAALGLLLSVLLGYMAKLLVELRAHEQGLEALVEQRTAEVQASEMRYRAVAQSANDAIVTADNAGNIVGWNRAAETMFGYTEAEVNGQPLTLLIPRRYHDRHLTDMNRLLSGGEPHLIGNAVELVGLHKNKNEFPLELSLAKWEIAEDCFVTGIIRDITERKRIQDAALREKNFISAALDSLPGMFYVIDDQGRFLRWNKNLEMLSGYSSEEVSRLNPTDLFADPYKGIIADRIRQVFLTGETTVEADFVAKDQTKTPYFFTGALVQIDQKPCLIGMGIDITMRKRAEESLRESEQELRAIFEGALDGILVVDTETRKLLTANAAICGMLGYTQEEIVRISVSDIHRKQDLPHVMEEFESQLHGRSEIAVDIPVMRKDGSVFYADIKAALIRLGGKDCLLGIFRDITERKQAEDARKHREAELQESQRIARIGSWEWTIATGAVTWSDGMNHVLARDRGSPSPTFETLPQFYTPESWQRLGVVIARAIETGASYDLELEMIRAEGATCWTTTRGEAIRGADGTVVKLRGTVHDITARKEADARIAYLNRVYVMLSDINTLIVRVRDRDELFKEACRIAVEAGGFRAALMGVVDRSAMKIVTVALEGTDEGLLTAIKDILSSSGGEPTTMAAQAIREKKATVANDSQRDPKIGSVKTHAEFGVRSMAILPLIVADEAVGVLALYASEIEFFQEEELKLLTELAGDISFAIDHIEKQARLDYLAYYDELTGLANRTLFLERVAQYKRSAVSGGHQLALFLIDLERFKNINDSLGRPAGDALLKQVAEWLTQIAGDANFLARVGADHFAAVLPQVKEGGDVARLVEKWMEAFLEHPFRLNDAVFRVAIKAGVALFPDDGANAETLFRNAEAALKKAKASGERYLFYRQEMTEKVASKLTLENQLRQALDQGEFVLHYQPKGSFASGKLTGAEALIRWNDPRTGLVPPGRFIPILEETGLIYEVGRWALRQAIADYLRWRAAGLAAVRIAVNVSPLQLRHRGFVEEIGQVIGIDAQAAAGLELEITESLIMEDVKHNIASLQAIRAMGVTIAIDDFGTGFSSLSYLAKLPVDTLKIDRSFVIDMTAGPEGLALVSTIINLAHSLKLKVVAEGVETEEQSRLLRLLSCDEMQGFLFSKPVPAEIFETRFLAPPPAG
jgi:diguanylate cyclase (GGDEF)-like protein/PAS domain S-box-containing protein